MLAQRQTTITGETSDMTDPAHSWEDAMRRGDIQAAWAVNDAVLAARDPNTRNDPHRPPHERWLWDGTPPDGRHVLVRCYHGLGDTLQFCRFLPSLAARAAHVTLEVQPELLPLIDVPAAMSLHPFDPAHPLPAHDCEIEVMELCHALRQKPDPAPYLHAKPQTSHDQPSHDQSSHDIGLCWAAGGWDPERSLDPETLRPLLGHTPAISLQRGPGAAQAAILGAIDPLHGSMDITRMARLLASLDAIVTVDTMVAHLAGALGRPTFVLLKHHADWRWGAQGSTSCLWYETIRTIRQPTPGDWPGAIARLRPILLQALQAQSAGTLATNAAL